MFLNVVVKNLFNRYRNTKCRVFPVRKEKGGKIWWWMCKLDDKEEDGWWLVRNNYVTGAFLEVYLSKEGAKERRLKEMVSSMTVGSERMVGGSLVKGPFFHESTSLPVTGFNGVDERRCILEAMRREFSNAVQKTARQRFRKK